jgi:hypothetical protein
VAACRRIEFLVLKPRRRYGSLALIPFLIILGFITYYFAMVFEDEAPSLFLEPLPQHIFRSQEFALKITDKKRGVRSLALCHHGKWHLCKPHRMVG